MNMAFSKQKSCFDDEQGIFKVEYNADPGSLTLQNGVRKAFPDLSFGRFCTEFCDEAENGHQNCRERGRRPKM